MKFVDVFEPFNVFLQAVPFSSVKVGLNSIGAGTGSYQRTGNRIALHKLEAFLTFRWVNVIGFSDSAVIHHHFVWDRQPTLGGIAPDFTDIFGLIDIVGLLHDTQAPLLRPDVVDRFEVLHYETTAFPGQMIHPAGTTGDATASQQCNFEIDLEGLQTQFRASPAAYASIASGSLLYFAHCSPPMQAVVLLGGVNNAFRIHYSDCQ